MEPQSPALGAHIALEVRNLEASVDFYRRFFCVEPAKVRPGYAKFDLQDPALNFTLNQVMDAPKSVRFRVSTWELRSLKPRTPPRGGRRRA